jgi:hypothetical protein
MNTFLTMTDNISSQNTDIFSWITLYVPVSSIILQSCHYNILKLEKVEFETIWHELLME